MDEIEQLLEGGKAEAAAQRAVHSEAPSNGHTHDSDNEGKSERKREPASPSARSHSSSHRSHRRRRDRSVTPRGDRARSHSRDSRRSGRDNESRRSSHRSSRHHEADDAGDDDRKSVHSSSSKRDREGRNDENRDDRKRRRSRSRSDDDEHDRRRSSHRSSRRDDSRERERERRSDRDRDRDRDYRRSDRRDRDRDDRDRRSSYGRGGDRESRDSRRNEDRRESRREASPSARMTEEEHEARSVFVTQLAARIGDRELFHFMEQNVGKVRDARVILDRVSRRSKGVAYVEFMDIEDVRKAINLTGTKLLGIPIVVQYTEAERNRQAGLVQRQSVPEHITIPPGSDARGDSAVPWNRIYVGSLPFSLRENDIRQIFEPFGYIDSIDLHFDNLTQKSKGYCFVQYHKMADAQQALDRMNGFEIAGRPIRVGLVTEKGTSTSTSSASTVATSMRQSGGMQRPDSLEEGASLNNISRIELMQKLARTEPTNALAAPSKPMFRVNVPTATSKSVLLKNMFNPAEETEPDWDTELRDDVKSECEDKYGRVVEIHVDRDSAGEIYLRFDSLDSAAKAIQGLNGRFFGGQQVSAQYISDALFDAHRK